MGHVSNSEEGISGKVAPLKVTAPGLYVFAAQLPTPPIPLSTLRSNSVSGCTIPCAKPANGSSRSCRATSTTTRYQEPHESGRVSESGARALVAYSSPPEPEAPDQLDAYPCIGYAMAPSTACAPSLSGCSLRRHSSEIRTGCANQRPSGSARGAVSDDCPYRDRQLSVDGSGNPSPKPSETERSVEAYPCSSKHLASKMGPRLLAHLRPTLVSPSSRRMSESPSETAARIECPSDDQDTRRAMKVARPPKSVI